MHFLTICHVELTQSTALEQKHFDLRSLSPALCNLWLLLVIIFYYKFVFSKEGKIAGRAVLIAGQPGTGKTAIAMGKMKFVIFSLEIIARQLMKMVIDNCTENYNIKTMIQVYLSLSLFDQRQKNPEKVH